MAATAEQAAIGGGASTPAAARPAGRVHWLDSARGVAILLVVYAHAVRSLLLAGIQPADWASSTIDTLIYSFHMAFFFVLSGLFARASAPGAQAGYVREKIVRIAYPYLLWSPIHVVAAWLAGSAANHPADFGALAAIGWVPIAHFWFLYVLFFCFLALLLPSRAMLLVLTAAGMVATLLFGIGPMWLRIAAFLPFFVLGHLIGARRVIAWFADDRRTVLTVAGAWGLFAVLAAILLLRPPVTPVSAAILDWSLALTGTAGTLGVARLVDAVLPILRTLGEASMPIYLLHPMASAAIRAMLVHFGAHMPPVLWAAVLTLAGIVIPYAASRLARRLHVAALAGFGPDRQRVIA